METRRISRKVRIWFLEININYPTPLSSPCSLADIGELWWNASLPGGCVGQYYTMQIVVPSQNISYSPQDPHRTLEVPAVFCPHHRISQHQYHPLSSVNCPWCQWTEGESRETLTWLWLSSSCRTTIATSSQWVGKRRWTLSMWHVLSVARTLDNSVVTADSVSVSMKPYNSATLSTTLPAICTYANETDSLLSK